MSSPDLAQRAYVLRLAERTSQCVDGNYLAIGWHDWTELDKAKSQLAIRSQLQEAPQYASTRAAGSAAGSIWRFMHEARSGDLFVVPTGQGFYVARCKSDCYFDNEGIQTDSAWRRRVDWLTSMPIPRDHATNALQLRGKARQTCVTATDLIEEIADLPNRTGRELPTSILKTSVKTQVLEILRNHMNDAELEQLVCSLARANGATAEVRSKRGSVEGDIDVIATSRALGVEVKVAYQVKQHRGTTDVYAVEQLASAMRYEDLSKGVVVSTADAFSQDAEKKVEELFKDGLDIVLMDGGSFSDWLLETGLAKLDLL